jgi:sulfide:quinone oxidoreductase
MTQRVVIAGRGFEIELVAPEHALEHRPASVAAPFGLGAPPPLDLHALADRYTVTLVEGELAAVDAGNRTARLRSGDERGYDHLLIAVGARAVSALPGSLTFRGPADVPMVEWALDEVARGHRRHVVVVIPRRSTWTLPAYELAIIAAGRLRAEPDATVTLVTPEREPLTSARACSTAWRNAHRGSTKATRHGRATSPRGPGSTSSRACPPRRARRGRSRRAAAR